MSEEVFDEDEMRAMEEEFNSLKPEDLFTLVMYNKIKECKVNVKLHDKEGDEVAIADLVTELVKYLKEKKKDSDDNQFMDQIYPLMSNTLVSGLTRLTNNASASFLFSNPFLNIAMTDMMSISFLLLKFIQQKELTISTIEEPMSKEDYEAVVRKQQQQNMEMMAQMLGVSMEDIQNIKNKKEEKVN